MRAVAIRRTLRFPPLGAALALLTCATISFAQAPAPEAFFGFKMGADGRLANAETIERYFETVATQSDRVKIVDIGATTEKHRTLAAIVSASANIKNLDRIRAVNQQLSDPRTLSREEALGLAATHKAVLAIGASIHASEIGATQAANELLYTLATSNDPSVTSVLENVVVILIPLLNPDGHRLVVDWYDKQKGTPFDGGPMPWLYHKYVGHDINRDAFMMNMAENRNLARFFYTEWHPQVFLTMHQMGSNGPRFFVPPNDDPIDTNYDPLIWRTAALLGSAMALEMQRDRRTGVVSNAMYDYYWPGYEDSAPLGHNTVCLLTEVASVRVASPITLKPAELRAGQRGLSEYRPQINFPDPWPGGSWKLRDIVDYDLSAVEGLLQAVSVYRETIVQNFYEMGRRAVDLGRQGGPFAFIIPQEQYDKGAAAKLEALLMQGAVEIHRALEPFRADGDPYPEGTDIILLAQPYRAYAKTLLERQVYPARRATPESPPERPYDVAGWTLPQQMGVNVRLIERTFQPPAMQRLSGTTLAPAKVWAERRPDFYVIDGRGNNAAIAANRLAAAGGTVSWMPRVYDIPGVQHEPGALVVPYFKGVEPVIAQIAADLGLRVDGGRGKPPADARPIARSRIALYKPWVENIDEGWTRWVLEQHEFPFASISDADIRAGNLRVTYDVIVLPSAAPERLIGGHPEGAVPPPYAGGLGDAGIAALKAFVEAGGTLVCLDQSGDFAIETFSLPIRNVARSQNTKLFCPGSILRLELDASQPLAFGMTPHTAGFFAFSSAYELASASPAEGQGTAGQASPPRVIARYADRDLLLSGWLEGEEVIAGRSAVAEIGVGTGRVVLLGFRVQHRGQSLATFRLLFNALLSGR